MIVSFNLSHIRRKIEFFMRKLFLFIFYQRTFFLDQVNFIYIQNLQSRYWNFKAFQPIFIENKRFLKNFVIFFFKSSCSRNGFYPLSEVWDEWENNWLRIFVPKLEMPIKIETSFLNVRVNGPPESPLQAGKKWEIDYFYPWYMT